MGEAAQAGAVAGREQGATGAAAEGDQFVRSVTLFRRRPTYARLDVLLCGFFAFVFAAFCWSTDYGSTVYRIGALITTICVGVVWLSTHWSMKVKCKFHLTTVTGISSAEIAVAVPAPHCGKPALCPLQWETPPTSDKDGNSDGGSKKTAFIMFQQIKFYYDGNTGEFKPPQYIDGMSADWYSRNCRGSNTAQVEDGLRKFGPNDLNIPIPSFGALFEEHATAPSFVFQIFCALLWLLDEYWYYSLFTLIMMILLELMVIAQRQRNFRQLHAMRRKPVNVFTVRDGKWVKLSSLQLVPGDIVSVKAFSSSSQEDNKRRGARSRKRRQQAREPETPGRAGAAPCDLLLLRGRCIVNEALLTGESIPLQKESVAEALRNSDLCATERIIITQGNARHKENDDDDAEEAVRDPSAMANQDKYKKHIVWAGTDIIQVSAEEKQSSSVGTEDEGAVTASRFFKNSPPDGGCIALVLRTGFGTTQGKLMRTILFATEPVTANSRDTLVFLGILAVLAVIASAYVLTQGLSDANQDQWKLFLHCIMIITTVIPPDLPIQLSLIVTSSLNALRKKLVFCTEPFRIPYAGCVDVCCFDKTGTLTEDKMQIEGFAAFDGNEASLQQNIALGGQSVVENKDLLHLDSGDDETKDDFSLLPCEADGYMASLVVAGCHSLVATTAGGSAGIKVSGDPMEQEAFEAAGFRMSTSGLVQPIPNQASANVARGDNVKWQQLRLKILRRHAFSSTLKRMTTIVSVDETLSSNRSRTRTLVVSKGAPEVLGQFITHKPAWYSRCHRHYTMKGHRVLALAWREVGQDSADAASIAQHESRENVEQNLRFAGFIMFKCSLKKDSKPMIKKLLRSSHRVMMITGDHPLTACSVASKLRMLGGDKHTKADDVLVLRCRKPQHVGQTPSLVWVRAGDGDGDTIETPETPYEEYDSDGVYELSQFGTVNLCVTGDAINEILHRTTRSNSEQSSTDDIDALSIDERTWKALRPLCDTVNIWARVSPWHKELIVHTLNHYGSVTLMCGDGTNDVGALKQAHVGISIVNAPRAPTAKKRSQEPSLGDAEIVQFGDASIASPFTARRASPAVSLDIVRQGRCTLVNTVQLFKILGLNSLISSYSLSVLYLFGVKQSDEQATTCGMWIAICFFFISAAKSNKQLHPSHPERSIWSLPIVASVVAQFIVHIAVLMGGIAVTQPYVNTTAEEMHVDGEFAPNVINTVVTVLITAMQVSIFAVNYGGWPHMQSLRENKKLFGALAVAYAVIWICISDTFPPLNDALELFPLPSNELRGQLCSLLAIDAGASVGAHWLLMKFLRKGQSGYA